MLTRIFALTLALLTVTAPAHAAVLAVDELNLNFGNGYTAAGHAGILTNGLEFGPIGADPLIFSFDAPRHDL